jgi:hypothetical protein
MRMRSAKWSSFWDGKGQVRVLKALEERISETGEANKSKLKGAQLASPRKISLCVSRGLIGAFKKVSSVL